MGFAYLFWTFLNREIHLLCLFLLSLTVKITFQHYIYSNIILAQKAITNDRRHTLVYEVTCLFLGHVNTLF